jgi:cytidylate kinase
MAKPKINIAIDGYSSTGKSTVARQLAQRLGYLYVDSGAMYRGVTFYALQQNIWEKPAPKEAVEKLLPHINLHFSFKQGSTRPCLFLNGEDVEHEIRSQAVAEKVSTVAAISGVRRFLVRQQRAMAAKKGVVMDGRDIGTVVLPDAELKVFMTANTTVRVQRRYLELKNNGEPVSEAEVAKNLKYRDTIDTEREDSPLVKAPDALFLDNSYLNLAQQLEQIYIWAQEKIKAS